MFALILVIHQAKNKNFDLKESQRALLNLFLLLYHIKSTERQEGVVKYNLSAYFAFFEGLSGVFRVERSIKFHLVL